VTAAGHGGGTARPALVVVSGPPGSGKTTLARKVARAVGCPAICRDEIKEGMVHAAQGFVLGPGDELTMRTLPVFFGVLELLLRAGVTTVAEAAFQDRLWRPGLEPLQRLAQIRIVHCTVDAELAFQRQLRRKENDPLRRAHADPGPHDAAGHALRHSAFDRVSLDVPWIEVNTTDAYRPGLGEIVAFVNGGGRLCPAGVLAGKTRIALHVWMSLTAFMQRRHWLTGTQQHRRRGAAGR
jgi:predicted kinase